MASAKPRIAVPVPTSTDLPYNQQCWRQYAEAVYGAGGEPVEIGLHSDPRSLRSLAATCTGICLPGSPADVDPARYGAERDSASASSDSNREAADFLLLEHASAEAKPVLGICFGLQSMNVWCGGTLVQDLHPVAVNHSAGSSVAVAHSVVVSPGSRFAALLDSAEAPLSDGFLRLPVNSSHHQAVAAPGDSLRIVARCPEDAVIEAVELDQADIGRSPRPSWMVGVQWHPERSVGSSAASRTLFRQLVIEAGRSSQSGPR